MDRKQSPSLSDSSQRRFYDALTAQESKFIPRLAADNLGLILRCAINELDWYYYNYSKREQVSHEQQEQLYILLLGVKRLIQLALDARAAYDVPVVSTRRNRQLTLLALETVSALGMIEHGRRVAQTISLGIGRIDEARDNEFTIVIPDDVLDDEYFERSVLEHYHAEANRIFAAAMRQDKWREIEVEVQQKLRELVYPFENHFIGYGADSLLDDYFFGLAYQRIQMQPGFDTFLWAKEFGGVRFQCYVLALTFLTSMCIRHERFSEALVMKEDSIQLENILTISSEVGSLIESIRDAVNVFGKSFESFTPINLDDAETIYSVFALSRKNTGLLAPPGAPLPLLIEVSKEGVIRCLAAAFIEPMSFLLESLRHHFPGDYSRNQQSREQSMQQAMQRLLDEVIPSLAYRENVKIRNGSDISTDIDFAILEQSTGTVVLCQLKHQELIGGNLHSKKIRGERLRKQVSKWDAAIEKWLKSNNEQEIRATLRIPKCFPNLKFEKLVVTMHFCHPLSNSVSDEKLRYANWLLFFNALELLKSGTRKRLLGELLRTIAACQTPSAMATHLPEPVSEWIIDDLKFTTLSESEFQSTNC